MQNIFGTLLGKLLLRITKLRGGSGQALPGLIIERLLPGYYTTMLRTLPQGIVIVTGTNGKTTTTKMIVSLLNSHAVRVLTNPTGSNLTRGINSMLIQHASLFGKLTHDIAVLELDEAYARQFVKKVKPRWVVALNVNRDQLDRFGEVDIAAQMIVETMQAAEIGIVTNADDLRLADATRSLAVHSTFFGVATSIRKDFPADNELVAVGIKKSETNYNFRPQVILEAFTSNTASYRIGETVFTTTMAITGQHNYQNGAAALTLALSLLRNQEPQSLINDLSKIGPAFGRGEMYRLKNGSQLRMVLVKNPSGFQQALASYLPHDGPIMIAANDNIADGRDVSWYYDVHFDSLQNHSVHMTTGTRAVDMSLRLQYENIETKTVMPDMNQALHEFIEVPGDKLLFTTYTAMLWFYKYLQQYAEKNT